MKNLLKSVFLLLILLYGCKKQVTEIDNTPRYENLAEVKKAFMKEILLIASKSPQFKAAVESECLKQVRADYNVALDRLLEMDKQSSIIPVEHKASFASLNRQMKEWNPGAMPILFVPVMESRDPNNHPIVIDGLPARSDPKRKEIEKLVNFGSSDKVKVTTSEGTNTIITMVDRDNQVLPASYAPSAKTNRVNVMTAGVKSSLYILPPEEDPGGGGGPVPCVAPYFYPGYILDDYSNLTYSECISEEFAWTHDVWVLGYEEDVSPGNMVKSDVDETATHTLHGRWQNFSESTGFINVTNIGAIEPWVRGKLEFRYYIHSESGGLIIDHPMGKLKRGHFDHSDVWTDLNQPLGLWNTATWGSIMYEHWIEENGGPNVSITSTITYVNGTPTLTTVFAIGAKQDDIDLGSASVQFTDPIWYAPLTNIAANRTVYRFSNMNLERIIGPQ